MHLLLLNLTEAMLIHFNWGAALLIISFVYTVGNVYMLLQVERVPLILQLILVILLRGAHI